MACSKSAPILSILLMKQMRGTPYLSAWRQTVSDCGSTPCTASKQATAPSSTRKTALDFRGKVHVARGIDNIDSDIAPGAGGSRGGDGDAALLLLLHPIHRRSAFMHFADAMGDPGVEQNPLRRCGLAGIDVGHDSDIPTTIEWY